jgi:hypothetical protein
MAKPTHHKPPPILDLAWIRNQFEHLHLEHIAILERIDEVKKLIIASGITANLNPELTAALLETAKKAKAVDEKVPDSKCFPQTKPPTSSNERTSQ